MAFAGAAEIRIVLPYFFAWRNSGAFPDGNARLDQPAMLLEAFGVLAGTCSRIEEQKRDAARKKTS